MMKRSIALLLASIAQANAQSGTQLPAGTFWGNPTATQGLAQPATITQMIDRAACAADNNGLMRQAGVWSCLSSTGTGNFVRATSPTIASPTITTPTITGGTINNTTIGATTRVSGAFTTLGANGLSTLSGAVTVGGGGVNMGSLTRAQLETLCGTLDNTGKTCIGWNYASGEGALSVLINRNGGTNGGLKIYDVPNGTGAPTEIFELSGGGTLTTPGSHVTGAGNAFSFLGRGQISSPADSVLRLINWTNTDFSLLQFGGGTSTFPAFRRGALELQAVLADQSAYTNFRALDLIAVGNSHAGAGNDFIWTGRSRMDSPADGIITFRNQAQADFNMLRFGGDTAAFPAIKRNSAQFQLRTADDSAFTGLTVGHFEATGGVFGTLNLQGATSGQTTFHAAAVAGATNFRLPGNNGTVGQLLRTDGAGNTSWVSAAGSGTVTSVSVTPGTGITQSGSPVTTSGAITVNIDKATAANYYAATANKVLTSDIIYQDITTTAYAASITFDFNLFTSTQVPMTGNITTQTVSNTRGGKAGMIYFIQDATGGRTTVWNAAFKFPGGTDPTLSTAPNAVDALTYHCTSTNFCVANLLKDVK